MVAMKEEYAMSGQQEDECQKMMDVVIGYRWLFALKFRAFIFI
jgi:hypothetical protein